MIARTLLRSVLLCAALAVGAHAQETGPLVVDDDTRIVGGEFSLLLTRLRGRIEYEKAGGIGQTVHLGRHLEYDAYEPAYEAEVWVWLSKLWRVEGRWLGANYRDRGVVRRDFVHDQVSFLQGERIRSEIDIHLVSFGARWVTGGDTVKLSLPFGILYTQQRLLIEGRGSLDRANSRVEVWSPYVGFGVQSQFNEIIGFSAEARTFIWAGGRVDRHGYFEAEANLTLSFLDGRLRAHTGPRVIAQDYHAEFSNDNDRTSDFTITAWQFGVQLEF